MIRRGVQFLDCERVGPAWTDAGLVFTTKSGLPVEPRNLNRSFDRICNASGIRRGEQGGGDGLHSGFGGSP